GWLPEPLRTPGQAISVASPASESGLISPSASGEDAPVSECEAAMPDVEYPLEDAILPDEPLVAAE
ncbi:MAG: hypothetical protein E7A86_08790, partial [Bradyrhizobium sp.]|nr:hypothetical protein [Bradyrhizobium sp.]